MKQMKRFVALLLAASLCLSLCGCRELDEMRALQAFWNSDGTIQWNNATYKALPECEEFSPMIADRPTVYVTAPDVPVLLSAQFGQWMDRSEDNVFLWLESGTIYCRADKYDNVVRRINEGYKHEGYVYYYYTYDEKSGEYRDFTYRLNATEEKTLNTVLSTVEPLSLPKNATMEYEYGLTLYSVSDDLLFRREGYDVSMTNDTYYVVDYGTQDATVYEVPSAYESVFASLMETYLKAENYGVKEEVHEDYIVNDAVADSV